jgi:signal transduction histidine kinase
MPEKMREEPTELTRLQEQTAAMNQQLIHSSLRQHEFTARAEEMNAQLQVEITERKQVETELRVAQAQLTDQAARLEQTVTERTAVLRVAIGELEAFSYTVSHDLRAPLRAIQSFATLLLEDAAPKLNPEESAHLQKIIASAARMDALINDVLAYTRVLRQEIKLQRVDVEKLVRELISTYPELQSSEADISIEGALPPVCANPASLSQCISNLLTNAVKFVAAGTRPRLKIRAESIGPVVRLWFEDNGLGIAQRDRERIFKMFERAGDPKAFEGTGMGLAIVHKAVERMGGAVGVEPAVGQQGSLFWIQLPKA